MKNSTLKFLLLISVILNIAILGTIGYSYYRNSSNMPAPSGPGRRAFLIKELSLNPEQAELLVKNEQSFHDEIDNMRQQIFLKRLELLNLMKSDKPDTKKIDQTISDIGNMQEGIQRKIVAHIIEVKTMLNNEQQKQFFGLIETIITKREDGRHGPRGPHR
jgi:Spy/CpxP family protein refolding chaperone